jgi:CheY-like chemotaxis protein
MIGAFVYEGPLPFSSLVGWLGKTRGIQLGTERTLPVIEVTPSPLRILVVDDEESVCMSIRMLLMMDGHLVETALSGEEALVKFAQAGFDLVLTDYSMSGMKGADLAVAIKASAGACPVLVISAYAQMLPKKLPFVDGILGKPFSREELRNAINGVILAGGSPDHLDKISKAAN